MSARATNYYTLLGLDRGCTQQDIRMAYRALVKEHHPDVNASSPEAKARIQAINEAYAILHDPAKRQAYDNTLSRVESTSSPRVPRPAPVTLHQDIHLHLRDFLEGISLDITVRDPAHPDGMETYRLDIPPETAPGAKFRIARESPVAPGWVVVRVKARPDRMFKAKGSDVQCDLRINARRAATGGHESLRGLTGTSIHVEIPAKVTRNTILRIPGEGLPKPRGGRGDLLVRVTYRPEVTIRPRNQ